MTQFGYYTTDVTYDMDVMYIAYFVIKEHENLAKELDDKIKKFLPRK